MINTLRRRRRIRKFNDVSLTPLIDVALTLLVALMIAMPVTQNSIKISLPTAAVNEYNMNQTKLIVNIDNENNLYLNNQKMVPDQLLSELMQNIKQFDGVIFLQADQSVNYGFLIKVIDCVKSLAGVKNVVLLTNRLQ